MSSFNALKKLTNKRTIVWLRNDQRLIDNPILAEAVKIKEPTILLYCFDPRHYENTDQYNFKKCGVYRSKFLTESIKDLRKNLENINASLLVAMEKPEIIIPKLMKNDLESTILVQHESAYEEYEVEKNVHKKILEKGNGILKTFRGNNLYHKDDLPYADDLSDMGDVYTPFKNKLEKFVDIRETFPTPKKNELICINEADLKEEGIIDSNSCSYSLLPNEEMLGFEKGSFENAGVSQSQGVMLFNGGESAALDRVQKWMWDDDKLKEYFEIRNGMLGEGYSTKLSPYLGLGNISPKWIRNECKRYENVRNIENKSTYWVVWELTCRDYFHYHMEKYGKKAFFRNGMKNIKRPWTSDKGNVMLDRWLSGTTGMPLVDANMRELAATGWMSNRGRQNVASYLALDMSIDWRAGAEWFESMLIDHDVNSNYGNWNAMAGLTGGRINRFNIVKQSKDYDPDGEYIKKWCPELKDVPVPLCFEPHKMSRGDQERFNCIIGGSEGNYPAPMKLGMPYTGPKNIDNSGHGSNTGGKKGRGKNKNRNNQKMMDNNDGRRGTNNNNNNKNIDSKKNTDKIEWYVN